jgi:hypothetical protein
MIRYAIVLLLIAPFLQSCKRDTRCRGKDEHAAPASVFYVRTAPIVQGRLGDVFMSPVLYSQKRMQTIFLKLASLPIPMQGRMMLFQRGNCWHD